MAEQQQKQVILGSPFLTMWADKKGENGQKARLVWSHTAGRPRITVFTNDPNDNNGSGIIYASVDSDTFLTMINNLEKVALSPNEQKFKIECYKNVYVDNKRTDDLVINSEVWFGKDSNGLVWISVIAPNRPKCKFTFALSFYNKTYKSNGEPLTEAEASTCSCLAKVVLLKNTYKDIIAPPFKPVDREETPVVASKPEDTIFEDIGF